MFGEATAQSCCHTLCNKSELKKQTVGSRGCAPVLHSWQHQWLLQKVYGLTFSGHSVDLFGSNQG